MHHSDKNHVETNSADVPQDDHLVLSTAALEEYIYNDNDRFLQMVSNDINNADQDADHVSINMQQKKTLFNIRFTSLGKRLSDRFESENEGMDFTTGRRKIEIKGGKKSRRGSHLMFEDISESKSFEIVPQKATKFGRGISYSDSNFVDGSYSELNDGDSSDGWEDVDSFPGSDVESWDVCHLPGTSRVSNDILSNVYLETQEATITDEQPEDLSCFPHKSPQSSLTERNQISSSQKSKEKSVLVDDPARIFNIDNLDDASLRRATSCQQDGHETVLPSSLKTEQQVSAAKDCAIVDTSADLADDETSPASPAHLVTITVEDEESCKPKSSCEMSVLEHSSQLDFAFTEFVNTERFRASMGSKSQHTAEGNLVTKYEKQLDLLLRAGSTKGLKSYLRNSQWPAESVERRQLWESLCNHLLNAEEHLYHKLVEELPSVENENSMLPSIVDPDSAHSYFLTASGRHHAKTVVHLISNLHPDITYCPILYPMACLFLHYMPPEACFNCLQALLGSTKSRYFTQTLIKTEASKYVLQDLARKYAKPAYDLIIRRSKSVEDVFANWMWWIFRDLPFQYLVRIVDSFLLEGYKIFYRISLAIVILFVKSYGKSGNQISSASDIKADISQFCTNMTIDPKKLIQAGFGIRGLSRKEISKLHEKNELYLTSQPGRTHELKPIHGPNLSELVSSAILEPEMLQNLWQWIPVRLSLMKPTLLFSSNEHGTAIRTLYSRTELATQTILAIKTTNNEIFGAFCSSSWYTRHEKNKPKTSFFGTGETFVFSILPEVRRYSWSGLLADPPEHTSDLFMAGDDHMLMIGSGNGTAIYLDATMNRCSSSHCDTFDNGPLCPQLDFSCHIVEVYGFIE